VIRQRAGHDHTSMRHVLPAALVAAAMLAGCGGDDTATTPAAPAAAMDTIRIADFLFEPDRLTVKAGQKIAIDNADSAPHTVTEAGAKPSFDSGTVIGHKRGSVTFSRPGTFKYFCQFHPTMKGTVTVTR
jgi:plastocyanin